MAHMYLYLSHIDKRNLVEFLCDRGFELIPGHLYSEPRFIRCNSVGEFYRFGPPVFDSFLVRPDYEACPPEIHRLPSKEQYVVVPREGGPTIDISWPYEWTDSHGRFIRDGSLSHYPTYWNTILGENVPAPETLRKAFREIVGFLKRGASRAVVRTAVPGRHYQPVWTGPHAASEWREGNLRLLSYGPDGLVLADEPHSRGRGRRPGKTRAV